MIFTRVALLGMVLNLLLNGHHLVAQPVRDPHTPGYVTAIELPDSTVPSPHVNGNFIIGPAHPPAKEVMVNFDCSSPANMAQQSAVCEGHQLRPNTA